MSRPIPRHLLPHRATLRRHSADQTNQWDDVVSKGKPIELKYVRFEPTSKVLISATNEEVQLTAYMFYDCRNSSPTGLRFALKDRICFDGVEYEIVDGIIPETAHQQLHHYELGLR